MKWYSKILLWFFTVFTSYFVQAQYTYYFQNYSIADYKAGNQNWDIQKSGDGKIYSANNDGLLEFDGSNWNLWKLPNNTTVRSILVDKNKIYVGSYEEFGYFYRNDKGLLEYKSLINLAKSTEKLNQEFWQIIKYNNAVIFRSFARIYKYENGKLNYFEFPSTVMSCDLVNNQLLISTLHDGIFSLKNNKVIPYFNDTQLKDSRVVSVIALKSNTLLITTALNGLFLLENNKLTPWNTEINTILKKYQLNRFSSFKSKKMIFGTIKNGLYITDNNGNILQNISKKDGLINNTILGQYVSADNQLWLGLDNGISFVDLNTQTLFYNDVSGTLGAVYDVINYKNTIYIGSNTGLYYINKDNKLNFINGSQGQVWYLKEINGNLFCGHNNGTYLVENNNLKLIGINTGGWVIKKIPDHSNTYVEGTYTGLVRYKYENDKWHLKAFNKIKMPVRQLVFEDEHTAWIAHASEGLYKIKFDKNYDSILEIKNYKKKGLWSSYAVRIYKLKNTIVFHTLKGWQKYEPLLDSIVPYKLLSNKFLNDSYIISENNMTELVFKTKNSIIETSLENLGETTNISLNFIKDRLIKGNEKVSKLNDSTFALNLYDGFMLFNGIKFPHIKKLKKPTIAKIIVNNEVVKLTNNEIEIPYANNLIKFVLTSQFSQDKIFEYKLSNFYNEGAWQNSTNGIIEFSNLSDGTYNLKVRAIDSALNKSDFLNIEFTILKPWYKGTIGILIYSVLALIIIYILYKLNKRKIKKEQDLLKLKYEERQNKLIKAREIENEKRLINLKNESLKNELKLKSKQLANTAMALVKKNETLVNLKQKLMVNKINFNDHFSFKKIVSEIDNSIEHKDEWEIFEYNFNQVHEDFFNKLKSKYPELNLRDLKTCAYLKMNLSSKEIASLLNITVRGVETQRYRIKQKLGLTKNESLSKFLQNLN